MTTFLLIRHAAHDLLGRILAGRAPDVHINARGKMEAELLAERLGGAEIGSLYTGPLERSQETAWPLAGKLMLPLRVHEGVDEIDFGEWTRKSFAELDPIPAWQLWNSNRSQARCPSGESMQEVQQRIVRTLQELSAAHRGEHVAVISHGDVIKAALMYYLGIPLDHILRLEISPASVSVLTLDGEAAQVTLVNDTGEFSGLLQREHGGRRRVAA